MTSLNEMIEECKKSPKKQIFVHLQNRMISVDHIEILPGLIAKVIVHGCPKKGNQRHLPTIAVVQCKDLADYAAGKKL